MSVIIWLNLASLTVSAIAVGIASVSIRINSANKRKLREPMKNNGLWWWITLPVRLAFAAVVFPALLVVGYVLLPREEGTLETAVEMVTSVVKGKL